jgi:phosphonoacetaldehyde hydrolase
MNQLQTSTPQLAAILFDWAGTTIDFGSRGPLAVFMEVFRRRGVEISTAEARGPMGSAKREHISQIIHSPRVSAAWQTIHKVLPTDEDVESLYQEFLPLQKSILARHSDVIPGVPAVVEECRRRGIKIGSTTGYTRELMQIVTPLAAAAGYSAETVITADDVPQGRPAPWANFLACQQLHVYPLSRVLVVDDTLVGIAAGRNAGAWTIAVVETGNELGLSHAELDALTPAIRALKLAEIRQRFLRHGAHYTVDSVADLLPFIDIINARLASGERPTAN